MKENIRIVPKKNYVILGLVIIISLVILYYFYMWFSVYNDSKISVPILDKYMNVINYNELNDYIIENPNSVIYVSIIGDMEINKFEKRFKNYIKGHEFNKEILYMNITDDILDRKIVSDMKDRYMISYQDMTDVPNIMVFEDGNLVSIYNIKDNDYDLKKIQYFVNGIRFNDGDNIDD